MTNFLHSLLALIPTTFISLTKAALTFVGMVALLWGVLFSIHLAVPSGLVAMWSPEFAAVKEEMFRPAAAIGLDTREEPPIRISGEGQFLYGLASNWSDCLVPKDDQSKARIDRLGRSTQMLAQEIGLTAAEASAGLEGLRSTAFRFAWTLILLGMATTIVSALNSSEFGSGSGRWASIIKVTAIILPALATAITAYAALYTPPDLATRKAQLVSNLSGLGSDMAVTLSEATCPISKPDEIAALEKQMSGWRKRLSEVVSNANVPSPSSSSPGQTGTPKQGDGGGP